MLNELFEVGKFINDNSKHMMDRYMEHLVKVLVTNQDEFMKRRYEVWKNWGQKKQEELNFYERMKIDGMVRGAKQEQAQESHLKDGPKRKAATLPEDIDSDDS